MGGKLTFEACENSVCFWSLREVASKEVCFHFLVICRLPFKSTQDLEPQGRQTFSMTTALVIKMKANMADVPYVFEKGSKLTAWKFTLTYALMTDFLPLVHQYFAASRMPSAERDETLQVGLRAED